MKKCKDFYCIECIDGSCPNAKYEDINSKYGFDIAQDMGVTLIECRHCSYRTGVCNDCINEDCKERGKYEKETK